MTTTLNATVRAPFGFSTITGVIGAQSERDPHMYAIDFTINNVPMRVWRRDTVITVIGVVGKSLSESIKTAPISISGDTTKPDTHPVPIEAPQIASVVEIKDTHNDTQRDNGPDRIQVNVKHLAERDVIEQIRLDLHRPYDTERLHIMSITPHIALEPRRARVAVFRGIQRNGESNWTSCGFVEVEFKTLTVAPYMTVVGGPKLDAARRDPALLERTNMMTLPRWKGGGDVMRLPMLEAENYGVIAA